MLSTGKRWILLGMLALCSVPAAALTELRGQTASGAYFIAQTPDGWRSGGTLVLINHGYDYAPVDASPDLGPEPLRLRMLAKGYAVAASSYSQTGWALFRSARDHRELVDAFSVRFGRPGAIIASGGSLGGLVSMQQAEQGDLGAPVTGVYAICAPLAGSRVWHQALDLRLSYDTVCANVTGGELPRGDDTLPYILKASDLNDYASANGGGELALRIAKCTGVGLPDWLTTAGMRERRERIQRATGLDPDFFLENMFYATYGLGDLYRDPAKMAQVPAVSSRNVNYGDASVDRDIRRVSADAFGNLDLLRHFAPSGQVGNAKVLTTHTSRDGLVVPEHARALEGKLPAAQWSQAFVVESSPSHCGYSDAELLGGFEALTRWLDGGAKPDTLTIQADCQRERSANPALGACRYDPNFQPGTLDSKLKPRNDPAWPVDISGSGLWFDPARSGEGYVIEALGGNRVSVTFFTFPAVGQTGDQAWFTGTGRVVENNLIVDRLDGRRGGRFAAGFDPAALTGVPLGRFDAALNACGQGEQRILANAPFDNSRRALQRLSRVGSGHCPGETVPVTPSPFTRWSGAWYEADKPGRGVFLQVQDDGRAFLVWFSFRADGEPAWIIGEGHVEGADLVFPELTRPVGTRYGSAFDANAVRREPWGSARLSGNGCGQLALNYQSVQPGYGQGRFDYSRLTVPLGAGCAAP